MHPLVPVLIATLGLASQAPRPTEVQERRLANGARLLVVERRGLEAFHATLVFRGGRADEPTALAGASDLLAQTLYGATWPEDLEGPRARPELDTLLKEEEGLLESIRLERLRRGLDATASQLPGLEANLEAVQTRLKAHFAPSPLADLYVARGGRLHAAATADALIAEAELPLEAFAFWCRTEAQRLQTLQLSRFALERARLVARLRAQGPQGLALLLGAALPGHPYGRDLRDHLPALEALRWSELRSHARHTLNPEHLTLILVGGLSMETALPLVERHLGSLPVPPDGEDPVLPQIPADLGDRRVQAPLGSVPRLLTGWRLPPRRHPDHLALRMAAHLLGGTDSSRLPGRLLHQKALVREVQVELDQPGGRLPGLLVVDLKPADGHNLAELEGALHSEILRLQQEPIPSEEWQRALAQLEAGQLREQDDPPAQARALGRAWVEGGDWRLAETDMVRLRSLGPEAVQAAARAWLKPSHRTTVTLETAPDETRDPLEAELAQVLGALAALRIEDLAQRERLVTEGLRQLRMLGQEERLRTLRLLQAQLASVKR
jgi:zinc protease